MLTGRYRTFKEARTYVRKLKLKSVAHHWDWCKGNAPGFPLKPADIPSNPHQVYRGEWISFSDYLGTKRTATYRRIFWAFEDAREFARALNLGSSDDWRAYSCGDLHVPGMSPRPDYIPSNPNFTYRTKGWAGFGDWLGYGTPTSPQPSLFRPFEAAREFARSLNLSGWLDWRAYVRSAAKPADIPAIPHSAYRGKGWIDYGDWLGTGLKAYHQEVFLNFEDARVIVRSLGIKNQVEWRAYCSGRHSKLGPKPLNIPTNPEKAYASEWRGWAFWFGRKPHRTNRRSFRLTPGPGS